MATNSIKKQFLNQDNIKFIIKQAQDELCFSTVDENIVSSIVGIMNTVFEKYGKTKTFEALNMITLGEVKKQFEPQKNVKKFEELADMNYIYRPPTLKQQRQREGMEIQTPIKLNRSTFFSSDNVEFRPENGTWYNPDIPAFYNPWMEMVYLPKEATYFDAKTGNKIVVGGDPKLREFFIGKIGINTNISSSSGGSKIEEQTNIDSQELKRAKKEMEIIKSRINPNIVFTEHILTLDSRHRDPKAYISASHYAIRIEKKGEQTALGFINNLSEPIRSVRKIELIKGVIPNFILTTGGTPDSFLYIGLDEISGIHSTSSSISKNIFGRLQYDLRLPFTTAYLNVEPIGCVRTYPTDPLSTPLNQLTINLMNYNGTLFNFGNDIFQIRYWQTFGLLTVITTWLPHALASGDSVIFRYTTNPLLDNGTNGFTVTVINPTVFTIAVDSTTVAAQQLPNIGGPPIDPTDPANSAGYPYPTAPPNDPNNPTNYFGYVLNEALQNQFSFRIISERNIDVPVGKIAEILNY